MNRSTTEADLFDPWRDPIEPTPDQLAAYRARLVAYHTMRLEEGRVREAHELFSGCHYSWLLWVIDKAMSGGAE